MEVGDRFICYSGKVATTGTILKITSKVSYDISNGVKIIKREIVSENGSRYQYGDCFKIEGKISVAFLNRIIRVFTVSRD